MGKSLSELLYYGIKDNSSKYFITAQVIKTIITIFEIKVHMSNDDIWFS